MVGNKYVAAKKSITPSFMAGEENNNQTQLRTSAF